MLVRAKRFRELANELAEKEAEKNVLEDRAQNIPAPFCAMRCAKDSMSWACGATLEAEQLKRSRENNVHCSEGTYSLSPVAFTGFRIVIVQALRKISLGKELLKPYRNKYEFNRWSKTW